MSIQELVPVQIGIGDNLISLYTMNQPNQRRTLSDLFQIAHAPAQKETLECAFTLVYGVSPCDTHDKPFAGVHNVNLDRQYVKLLIEDEIEGNFFIRQQLLNDNSSLTITNPEEFQKLLYQKQVKIVGNPFGRYRNQINNQYSMKKDYEQIYPVMHTIWRLWLVLFPIYLLSKSNSNTKKFDWFRRLDFSSMNNPIYRIECISELFAVTVAAVAILHMILKLSYLYKRVSVIILFFLMVLSSYILGIASGLILFIGLILVLLKWGV